MKRYNVAILGATGAVGEQMIRVLWERRFPIGGLTLLWVGLSVTAGAFIVQLLLCISRARLCVKLIPLYFLGIYALFVLLTLTGLIWNDTNFYISAQQLIAVILAVIGAFAGAG